MQRPTRTVRTTAAPSAGTAERGAAAAASTRADDEEDGDVLGRGLAAAATDGHDPDRPRRAKLAPRCD